MAKKFGVTNRKGSTAKLAKPAATKPKKLKRARGALARAINAGLVPPPPGYEGPQKVS